MPDEIDLAQDRERIAADAAISELRAKAATIPQGAPGECNLCGEWFERLVRGACARCRDRYRLP
jgi:hypothetical protein